MIAAEHKIIYGFAKKVVSNDITRPQALRSIKAKIKSPATSTHRMVLDFFVRAMRGANCEWGVSLATARYMAERAANSTDPHLLPQVIATLRNNLEWSENSKNIPKPGLRTLIEEFAPLMTDQPEYHSREFQDAVRNSLSGSPESRSKRLKSAPEKAERIRVAATAYRRNPDVVAERLFRANGICQKCGNPAPFLRRADKSPFLEVHHIVPLASGGKDTVENTEALCPNCHRQAHFG